MGGKGGQPDPRQAVGLAGRLAEERSVATPFAEEAVETRFGGQAQPGEHGEIAVERGGQLAHLLVAAARQGAFFGAAFVNVGHLYAAQVEEGAQHFRAQHVVEVGHGIETILFQQRPSQPQQARQALVLPEVYGLKAHVGGEAVEERFDKRAAGHDKLHVGPGGSDRGHHGHGHGHVAKGGEPQDQDPHFF